MANPMSFFMPNLLSIHAEALRPFLDKPWLGFEAVASCVVVGDYAVPAQSEEPFAYFLSLFQLRL